MWFDPPTLMMLTVIIAVTVGLLLIFAFLQNRAYFALAIWGVANLLAAMATFLLLARNLVPDIFSIAIANTVLACAYSLNLAGARAFWQRPLRRGLLCAGPAIWLLACLVPAFYASTQLRVMLMSVIIAGYTYGMAREFWYDRSEPLLARYPAVAWLVVHATFYLGRVPAALIWTVPGSNVLPATNWFAILTFESLIHIIAMGFLLLSMAKERSELMQRRAAATDDLTGVTSRRAFLEEGGKQLAEAAKKGLPIALLLVDLDHFKKINDNHGHATGDRVLQAFAGQAAEVLRPVDLFGRIGGEEFAALLADISPENALAVAERLREAVDKFEFRNGSERLRLSVSVGVAITTGGERDLGDLMKQADHALYSAKSAGRNCVRPRRPSAAPILRTVGGTDHGRNSAAF